MLKNPAFFRYLTVVCAGLVLRGLVRHNIGHMMKQCRTLLNFLAKPTLFFYALPWLMVLLVAGTVAQRDLGLYRAEKIYFNALLFWLGPVPLPGAFLVLALMAVSLTAKLILKSPWRRGKLGTLITHGSMLVLLVGGLVSALGREEGYIELAVGDQSTAISDYHDRVLAVVRNGMTVAVVPESELAAGTAIALYRLPFQIKPQLYCRNCDPVARTAPVDPAFHGAAASMNLVAAPLLAQDEDNRAGVVFAVTGSDATVSGTYLAFDGLKQMPSLTVDSYHYDIIIRHAERELPFTVRLVDFQKTVHPGTDIARSYAATVAVIDGAATWQTVISMNEPLRYRGYTFYQASFIDRDGKLSSVLTVVRNRGQLFPYIAITMLCLGMGVHLTQHAARRRRAGA